ncbi:hypothetical protein SAMN04487995_2505 [Dyadobacter koreensis]|uniref:Por secretion system C-terminal sorting domain-containing protein n=1 Tax=Dyadobacter koreensis TaxID=408657 RepID=A0A1H6UBE8_9BACT|nr:hypothetical protein [Dyadobacter koreensis]SEI85555.1 hypothetical protein SAMN04487995_2505 [Dyadobacter koreensis]
MRTSFKNIAYALALVTSFTFAASAKETETKKASGFGTGIYINKAGKINVLVNKQDAKDNTTLLIKNEKGDVVYREIIQKDNQKFGRVLNVEKLEAGQYEINVVSKDETQTKSFQLSEQKTERNILIK